MIFYCGEAPIDTISTPTRAGIPYSGGAVLNTAVALGRLGAKTDMLTEFGMIVCTDIAKIADEDLN